MKPNPRFDISRYPVPVSHHLPIWRELSDTLHDHGNYCGLSWQIESPRATDEYRVLLDGNMGWRFVDMVSFHIPSPRNAREGVLIVGAAMEDLHYCRRVLATSLAAVSTLLLYADTIVDVERDAIKRSTAPKLLSRVEDFILSV